MFLLRRAALAATVLSLLLAPATFAATASSTVNESLSVNSSLTVSGCPTTLDFGAVDAGGSTPATLACAYSVGGNATSWTVTGTQSNLTGPGTINAGNVTWGLSPTGMHGLGEIVAGTPFTIGTQADGNQSVYLKVTPNGGAPAGAYTGTFVLSVSGS